jgi:hypothetical protein
MASAHTEAVAYWRDQYDQAVGALRRIRLGLRMKINGSDRTPSHVRAFEARKRAAAKMLKALGVERCGRRRCPREAGTAKTLSASR